MDNRPASFKERAFKVYARHGNVSLRLTGQIDIGFPGDTGAFPGGGVTIWAGNAVVNVNDTHLDVFPMFAEPVFPAPPLETYCTHPPDCVFCSWCGFTASAPKPDSPEQQAMDKAVIATEPLVNAIMRGFSGLLGL